MELPSQPDDPDPLPGFSSEEIPVLHAYIVDQEQQLSSWETYARSLETEECRFCREECLCVKSEEAIAARQIERYQLQIRLARFALHRRDNGVY